MRRSLLIGIITMTAVSAWAAPIIVTPSSPNNWVQTDSDSSVGGSYVNGPGTPPAGTGSFQMNIGPDGNQYVILRNDNDFFGMSLSDLTGLSYSTYQQNYTDGQAIVLSIVMSDDSRLYFEPVYQTGTYGGTPVPSQCASPSCADLNQWQTWNALAGGWWADDAGGPPLFKLSEYAALNPLLTIQAIRFFAGGGAPPWDNFVGSVDNLTVATAAGSNTYDFEADASVPEPSTILLLSVGLAGCGLLRRKRNSAKV